MGLRAKGLKGFYFQLREEGRARSVDNLLVRHRVSKETRGWRNGQTVSGRLLYFCREASPQKTHGRLYLVCRGLKAAGIKT